MPREERNYIGRALPRREDRRLLTGAGTFVADIRRAGMLEVAFARSPHAHMRIHSLELAPAQRLCGVLLVLEGRELADDLGSLGAMQVAAPPGWAERVEQQVRLPDQPLLALGHTRYSGEPYAVVVAETFHRAADALEAIGLQAESAPVALDPLVAREPQATLVHPSLGTNVLARMTVSKGDPAATLASAPHRLRRTIRHHRYAAMPIECRGVVAEYDPRTETLTVHSTTQVVHWVRAQIARALDLPEAQVRVIAPDVGGGFGVKGHVYPEEIIVAYLARRLGRPVRWIEQRQEHFLSATHARDQVHEVEVGFDDAGRILAIQDTCWVDSGAYSPVGAGVTYNTTAHLLGPYDVANFSATTTLVCTHKAPNAPYRGAGRPEAVQVMERVMDAVAAVLDIEPMEIRLRNMIRPEQMPFPVGLPYRDGAPIVYDSGDYPKALRRAVSELGGIAQFRARQERARERGRYLGLGLGCYTEGTGVGPFEGARVELDARGKLIVAVGACPQGQGHETVFAQVAADQWRMPIEDVVVRVADTAGVSMGYGTVGSRSAVTTSMAIRGASDAVQEKVFAVAGEMLESATGDLALRDGAVAVVGAPQLRVSLAQIAAAARPGWQHRRPAGIEAGLEASAYYEPPTVTWSYAAIAAIVEVIADTGEVRIERYVEVHDAGVLLNPALADGQIMGGIAQGIGGALHEAIVYDGQGQLLSGSFLDYAMPRARDVPQLDVVHQQTPSPLNPLGVKGLGEGGAIAPPVVIANAVADALAEVVARDHPVYDTLPLSAPRVHALLVG